VVFKEVDERLWGLVMPYFPAQKPKTGRLISDLRRTFNGILYVHKTGINWCDLPRVYGIKLTVYKLHMELCRTGVYQKINEILLIEGYFKGKIGLFCCNIDTKDVIAK
jgi:transposase